VTNASQYAYLKTKKLFLAWYTSNVANVLIPAPFTSIFLWQFGTPDVGPDYGVATQEIDMSYINMTEAEFQQKYNGGVVPPPTEEEDMTTRYEATSIYRMSLRPSHETNNAPIATIAPQSKMQGDVIWEADGEQWLNVVAVNGAPLAMPGWVAIINASRVYCTLKDNQPPAPVTFPPEIGVTVGGVTKIYVPR